MAKDAMQDYLDKVDKTGGTGTMQGDRKEMPSTPVIRPFFGAPRVASTFPSKAPKGMGAAVKGDLGAYRGEEADKQKNFKGDGRTGACTSKKLSYREPKVAIDSKYGPGDYIC